MTVSTAAPVRPEFRMKTLTAEHGDWKLEAVDDQPIPEGKKMAADLTVTFYHKGAVYQKIFWPACRIYTLLAHWTEGIPEGPVDGY